METIFAVGKQIETQREDRKSEEKGREKVQAFLRPNFAVIDI